MQTRIATGAGEIIDGVEDFERVSGRARERLVHVGEERDRRHAGAGGDAYYAEREFARALLRSA